MNIDGQIKNFISLDGEFLYWTQKEKIFMADQESFYKN